MLRSWFFFRTQIWEPKNSREALLSIPWTTGLIKCKAILFYDNTTEKEHTILHSYIQTYRLVTGQVTITTTKDLKRQQCLWMLLSGRGRKGWWWWGKWVWARTHESHDRLWWRRELLCHEWLRTWPRLRRSWRWRSKHTLGRSSLILPSGSPTTTPTWMRASPSGAILPPSSAPIALVLVTTSTVVGGRWVVVVSSIPTAISVRRRGQAVVTAAPTWPSITAKVVAAAALVTPRCRAHTAITFVLVHQVGVIWAWVVATVTHPSTYRSSQWEARN